MELVSENGSLTLSEVSSRREVFGFKREEVKGEWRKIHKCELHDFCSTLSFRIFCMTKSQM